MKIRQLCDEIYRINEIDVFGRLRPAGEPLSAPDARRWLIWGLFAFGFGAIVSWQLGESVRDAALGPYFWGALGLLSAGAGDLLPRGTRSAELLVLCSRVFWIVAVVMVPVFMVRAVLGGFSVQ